uniref:Reverse transcriptase domain-containing protein n=1 Tax=Tanacetum cinerariifolium TaxID=118510 RepID=A0A6L2JCP4_TANCI|nr:reverse transcriptase domain-containing protein [Tanacetum cinerariifolium]
MEAQYGKFLNRIYAVRINVPLIEVLAGIPNYGKFLKELISDKHKIEQIYAAFLSDESSAIIQNKVPPKLGYPRSFLIPCNFNKAFSCNALADLGASINLMPYSFYEKLSIETLKPTKMSVRLANRSFQYPIVIAENMLVEVEEGSKLLHSIEGTFLKEEIFVEFDEFMAMTADENFDSEFDTEEPPFEKITINTDYKIKTSLKEPPTDLKLKPLPDNLEYEKLTCAPVIISLNWILPFELVRDASDFAVRVILGQKDGQNFHPIYFASKTLNPVQQKYIVTEKELMAIVCAFDKFRSYLIHSKTIVHTDHLALRHLFKKQDAKPCLIRLILLLQEFDIEIKDGKGTENAAVDQFSRIKNDELSDDSEVDDNFLGETLMEINTKDEPWFAVLANYLVGDIIPNGMTYQQKKFFFSDLKHYFWEEPSRHFSLKIWKIMKSAQE